MKINVAWDSLIPVVGFEVVGVFVTKKTPLRCACRSRLHGKTSPRAFNPLIVPYDSLRG